MWLHLNWDVNKKETHKNTWDRAVQRQEQEWYNSASRVWAQKKREQVDGHYSWYEMNKWDRKWDDIRSKAGWLCLLYPMDSEVCHVMLPKSQNF